MSRDLRPLSLTPAMKERLPLGYRRILVSDDILDEETTKRLTFEHPKYRHASAFVSPPKKPISKVEL